MRYASAVGLLALGLALVPAVASAQLVVLGPDTYKAGPLRCTKSKLFMDSARQFNCTATNGPERSASCGEEQYAEEPREWRFTGCRLRVNAVQVECGDQWYRSQYGTSQFTGCALRAGAISASCGHWYQNDNFFGNSYDVRGCHTSGAVVGAACFDRVDDSPHRFVCSVGSVELNCLYAGDLPGQCRLSLPPVLDCDVDLADPAGSLVACVSGAGARRRG